MSLDIRDSRIVNDDWLRAWMQRGGWAKKWFGLFQTFRDDLLALDDVERALAAPVVPPVDPRPLIEQLNEAHMFAADIAACGVEPEKMAAIGAALRAARKALRASTEDPT